MSWTRALLVVTLLVPVGASAAEGRSTSLTVALEPGLADEVEKVGYLVRGVASRNPNLDYTELSDIAEGDVAKKRAEKAKEAKKEYDLGYKAYQDLEFMPAVEYLENSVRLWEQSDLSRHTEGLLRSLALLSATWFFSGEMNQARDAMERVIRVRPEYTFDKKTFSPDVLALAEELKTELETQREAGLEIQVKPVSARVYVDGVFRGMSDKALKGLATGRHIVTVIAPGFGHAQDAFTAGPGQIAQIMLEPAVGATRLTEGRKALAQAFESGGVADVSQGLAEWAGVEELLVAGVYRVNDQIAVRFARIAKDGHVLAHDDARVDLKDSGALGKLGAVVGKLHAKDAPRGPDDAPVKTPLLVDRPLSRATIGYITAGGGGLMGVLGMSFGFMALSSMKTSRALPQVEQDAILAANKKARSRAIAADTFYVLGLGAVAAGAWLAWDELVGSPEDGLDDGQGLTLMPVTDGEGLGVMVQGRF